MGIEMRLILVMLYIVLTVGSSSAVSLSPHENRILALKLQTNTSLNNLIALSGYSINDNDVIAFLTDFSNMNPGIRSISSLKKGSLVRVPVRHLRKTDQALLSLHDKKNSGALRDKPARRKTSRDAGQETSGPDKSALLRNVRHLFSALGRNVSVETEGFKYFPLSEKSDFSLNTGVFPVITLQHDNILVLDYSNSFPPEIRDLLEISWPEYRVVSTHGRSDLRSMVSSLLRDSGYLFQEGGRIISGGETRVVYYPDFLVYGRNGEAMDSDISLVSILDKAELRTPEGLLSWFRERDIGIVELADHDKEYLNKLPGAVSSVRGPAQGKEFAREILGLLGYSFLNDEKIALSDGEAIRFNLHADLAINSGVRKKVIEFSGISDNEIKYARRMGVDVVNIGLGEGRKEITGKILSVLSLNFSRSSERNVSFLTPGNTRYRLLMPGFIVRTAKGVLFMTDSDMDSELLLQVIREKVSIVRF
jgi:hypothetical protein